MATNTISNYAENKILGHVTGKQAWSAPSATYIGIFTSIPTDEVPGVFVVDAGLKSVTWGTASGGSISNTNTITFGPAGTAWGTIRGYAIFDSLAGASNALWYGEVTPLAVGIGDTLVLAAGMVTLGLD